MQTKSIVLQPSQADPGPYPTAPSFEELKGWQEGKSQNAAFIANTNKANKYTTETFGSWFADYDTGKIPWNAQPPSPPPQMVVVGTETAYDNGAFGFTYDLVEDPTGVPVCAVPYYHKQPPPQGGAVSLMQQLVDEGRLGQPVIITIPDCKPGETVKASNGYLMVRVG